MKKHFQNEIILLPAINIIGKYTIRGKHMQLIEKAIEVATEAHEYLKVSLKRNEKKVVTF